MQKGKEQKAPKLYKHKNPDQTGQRRRYKKKGSSIAKGEICIKTKAPMLKVTWDSQMRDR